MKDNKNYTKQYIDIVKALSYEFSVPQIFGDAIMMSSIALQNSMHFKQDIEDEYFRIIKAYSKVQLDKLATLHSLTVLALNTHPHDFLGDVYMQLGIANSNIGQFYTPSYVCDLMAQLQVSQHSSEKLFTTVNDPTCGSGAMLIAHFKHMIEMGRNPQRECWYEGQDISALSAHMCYVQMSLLGMPGRVIIGDSLTNCQDYPTIYTPFHYLGAWHIKLNDHKPDTKEPIIEPTESKEKSVTESIQASLF